MELVREWNETTYQDYIQYLKNLSDAKYKEFHSKLTNTKYEILGIQVPKQRKIAMEISKGDVESFLKQTSSSYYEDIMIRGFVIARIKNKETLPLYLDDYISFIDNWAICDSFCNSLKFIEKDKDFWFSYFTKFQNSHQEFEVRVFLIILLNFYVTEEYIDAILEIVDAISSEQYYVEMAQAWLLCECFIKFREKTLRYFTKNSLNAFTFNKTISKIRESYRVSEEDKLYLLSLKRREK